MRERLLRQSVCLYSQSPPSKLCVDDESLDSLGWCALVPPLPKVLRIRVGTFNLCMTTELYLNVLEGCKERTVQEVDFTKHYSQYYDISYSFFICTGREPASFTGNVF